MVDLGTGIITTLNSQQQVVSTIAFDSQHTLYTTNGLYIDAVDTASGTSTVIAGNGATSFSYPADNLGDGGPATDAYIFPNGVALDNAGNLYIADAGENGIRIVNLSTGVINIYAGGYPDGVYTGLNFGYSGDGGPASAATFRDISGLHSDGMGNLWLADSYNNAIREINLSSTIINTVAGNGSAGYSGDGASATAAMLNVPSAASADVAGNLYITADNRVRRVVVNPVALTSVLTTPSTSVTAGESVSFTATYSGITFGIVPTGAVTFYGGTSVLGTATLSPSQSAPGQYVATLTISTLSVGTTSVTAKLSPDANYAGVTSAPVTMVVISAPVVTLSSASLDFSSQVVGASGAPQVLTLTNSGTVALTITSIAASGDFAETNTCGASVAAGASCMISVTFLPTSPGTRTGTLTITDNAPDATQTVALSGVGASIALSSTSTTLTVASVGGTATAPIQIASIGGFTGSVAFNCTVKYLGTGTPNEPPACSMNPASLQLAASSPASSTLTISTTAASNSTANASEGKGSAVAFAALILLGLIPRRRWREGVLAAMLCLVVGVTVLGCGGSSNGSSTPSNPGTTVGGYQVVVTAASGTATSTVTIPITVQ